MQLGKAKPAVAVADAEPLGESEQRHDLELRREEFGGSDDKLTPLYRARFDASFVAGKNALIARYVQPLGAREHDYGYGSDGRFLKRFHYELWPLKEWRRAPTFGITVTLSMKRKPPALLSRWFGDPPTASCLGFTDTGNPDDPVKVTRFPATPTQNGDRLELAFAMRDGFSDRLQCFLGDGDLHP